MGQRQYQYTQFDTYDTPNLQHISLGFADLGFVYKTQPTLQM